MKTLYFKNFLISTCLVLVSFLILGVVFVVLGRGVLVNERQEGLESTANVVASIAAPYYIVTFTYDGQSVEESGSWRDMDLRTMLTAISRLTGNHVFICDEDGVVVSCSDLPGTCPHVNKRLSGSIMDTLEEKGKISGLSDLGGVLSSVCYIAAVPINSPDGSTFLGGYAFAASDGSKLMETWSTFLSLFSMTAVLILFLAMVMSYVSSKRLTRPLNEMTAAVRRFSRGEFEARVTVEPGRDDELSELTVAFNAMADSLEKSDELKNEFIANVSHELKTPMTTIAGFADGILDGTIPKENQDQYLMTISSETKRLSRLVRKMLELSQIQSAGSDMLKKRGFEIDETIRQTLINFESKITARGLDVEVLLPEEPIKVMGDADAITQVVYNLLDNAIKFAEHGSAISISLWKQGKKAFVSVKNRGDTIPPEQLPLIFDRFKKTDASRSRDRDGVGLGLYIVKSILNNHNEDIYAASKDGVTEFTFSLALYSENKKNYPGT